MPHTDPSIESGQGLAQAVMACRAVPAFLRDLAALYAEVDQAVAARGPRCMGGGACCRFDIAGHRLYASTGELAYLSQAAAPAMGQCRQGRCPYQVGPRCGFHAGRPLGCRAYFCLEALKPWYTALYERFHRRIGVLHQTHCVPYLYADLVRAMTQLFRFEAVTTDPAGFRVEIPVRGLFLG